MTYESQGPAKQDSFEGSIVVRIAWKTNILQIEQNAQTRKSGYVMY